MESALTNATSQTNFGTIDWVIVAVYLLLSVSIAFFVKRYAGNMTNFVSAGRAVGTWLGVATLTGTEMGLITVMYSAQKGFTAGFAAFHIGVIAGMVALIIGLTGFIVVRLREHKVLTIPEYYEKRFGRRTRILGGIMLAFGGLLNMGLFLKVGAMFIVGITGMDPDGNALKVVMVVLLALVLVYTVIGGMISVVITDYIQFIILSVGLLVAGWLAIESVGWDILFETVRTHKGEAGFNPVAAESGFGWEYVGWMFFLGIVNCALWPTAVARALAMESTASLKRQYTWSSISFAIRMIIPNLLGVCAFVFVMTKAPDLQQLFSPTDADVKAVDNLYAMPIFLGRILPAGLIGLITAAMIAAFMSTHDGYLLCWSTVITQDIIAPLFKERLDNPTRIKITRILIVLIGLYILYWGLFYTGEEDIWDYMAVTGAIYFTGAFSLLFGGLYWHTPAMLTILNTIAAILLGALAIIASWHWSLIGWILFLILAFIIVVTWLVAYALNRWCRASSTGAVLALLVGVTAVFGLGPVQDYVHTYIPGSIAERNITTTDDETIEFEAFNEPETVLLSIKEKTTDTVTVQVQLKDMASTIAGANFQVQYPAELLRLKDRASHSAGEMVASNAAAIWNISPAQTDYASQDGTLAMAVSSPEPWAAKDGVLAEISFDVEAGADLNKAVLTLSEVEVTPDGFDNRMISGLELNVGSGEVDEIASYRDMVVDFVMTPFEQAKPWNRDGLEGWTAVVRGQAGQAQTVEVASSWADKATASAWPDFEPRAGDTVSFYKPLSGARVGLMTIGFTLFVFILGSVVFPDRKTREAANE